LKGSPDTAAFRDIKPPLDLAGNFAPWVLILLLVAGILLWLAFRYFRSKKGAPALSLAPRPAHEIAYEQLEALRQKDLIRRERFKEYFIEVSDIIRHYIENRSGLHAPHMSTEEFLAHASEEASLLKAHQEPLKAFLTTCDMVKFAKYIPASDEADLVYRSAKGFIDQTKEEAPRDLS
jgi:hypothetical protein